LPGPRFTSPGEGGSSSSLFCRIRNLVRQSLELPGIAHYSFITTKGSDMCSGAGRDRERFGTAGPGAPRAGWAPSGAYRSGYEGWGYIPTAHQRSMSADRPRPPSGPSHRGRPGPFVGPAIVMAFIMAASLATASPHGTPLAPLLIFPIIAALMITRRHRPRSSQPRGSRSYREAVPAPWNRPDPYSDEGGSQRTVTTPATATATPKAGPSCPSPAPGVRSPFDKPAFWDEDPTPTRHLVAAPEQSTPPAWDPLGVAPFAWDLPEPPPARVPRPRWRQAVVARIAAGTAILGCILAVIGDVVGWWPVSTVVAASWAVIAMVVGLLIGSHRARAAADR